MARKRKSKGRAKKVKRPFEIYYFAAAYNKSASRLEEQTPRKPYIRPRAVLQSLSLEVFLKCIYSLRNRLVPKEHKLTTLFCGLMPRDRDDISKEFDRRIASHDDNKHNLTLAIVIARCDDLFETLRYGYERQPQLTDTEVETITLGLDQAIHSTQSLIRSLKKTYRNKTEARHLS
jgi:hypothetical protein